MDYGLIGEKLGHSFSKEIHESLASYTYEIHEVAKDDLDEFMKAKAFKAINVTIPYKQAVIPYLDHLDESAKLVGAVNTIINRNGVLTGFNTDYSGLLALIKKANIHIKNKKVLILGAGGASLACVAASISEGCKEVIRSDFKARDGVISFDELDNHLDAEIIFNATPVGMYPNNDGTLIDVLKYPKLEGFIDCVYNPLQTKTVISAKQNGIKAMGGLYMLVAQAFYAVEIFLDKKLDKKLIDDIYHKIVKAKDNISLIGMPSCGKSKLAIAISRYVKKEVIDIDDEIVKEIGMPIKDYMELNGEKSFREIETKVIERCSKLSNVIISTGGGAVLNHHNMEVLRQNGKIYFIDRPLELLKPTNDRPLSSDFESLKKRYNERIDKYNKEADYIIKNDDAFNTAIKRILEVRKNEIISY